MAYDIRGRLGADLDNGNVYRIGRGFARALGARRVVLGRDGQAPSPGAGGSRRAGGRGGRGAGPRALRPALQPLTILVNSSNCAAGATFDAVVEALAEAGVALRFLRQHRRGVVRRGKMPALAASTGRVALTGRVMHVCRGAIGSAF